MTRCYLKVMSISLWFFCLGKLAKTSSNLGFQTWWRTSTWPLIQLKSTVGRFHCGKCRSANCFEGSCEWSEGNARCKFWRCSCPFSFKVLGNSRPRGGKHSQFGQVGGVPKQACWWVPSQHLVSSLQFTNLKFKHAPNLHLYLGFTPNSH